MAAVRPQVLDAMLLIGGGGGVLAPDDAAVEAVGRLVREGFRSDEPAMPLRAAGLGIAGLSWLQLQEVAGGVEVQQAVGRSAAAWTAQHARGSGLVLAIGAGGDAVPGVALGLEPGATAQWRSDLAPDLLWEDAEPAFLSSVDRLAFESVLHPRPMTRVEPRPDSNELLLGLTRLLVLPVADWAVVFTIRPVDAAAVADAQRETVRLEREFGRRLSSSASVAHNETSSIEDPEVRSVLDGLGAWQSLLRSCAESGGWQVSLHCLAASAEELAVVRAAASSLLGSASAGVERTEQWWTAQAVEASARYGDCTGWLSSSDLGALLLAPREALGAVQVRRALPGGRRQAAAARPIRLGRWLGTEREAVVDVDDLAGHVFVAGITGSGKSTTTAGLLTQLWNRHRVPFLVIDPAKADYESVAPHLDGGLRVVSGERLATNVLAAWPGASTARHIARVSSAFRGAFGMPSPVPYVASMLFEQLADDAVTGPVTLHDGRARLDALVAELGYRGEIEDNIRASLGLRLRLLLQPRRAERVAGAGAPAWLVDRPTLVQLGDLGDEEERAFLAAMLVLWVADAARGRGERSAVEHVTVVEEAHRLMPEPRSVSSEEGDAGAVASRLMAQLLAEIRGYGEAVLVVDQSPAAVAREVIRNTTMKLAHRIVDVDDQRVLGGALGLDEQSQGLLGSLTPGRCLVSTRTLLRPQAVGVDRLWPRKPAGFEPVPVTEAPCHLAAAASRHHRSEAAGARAELLVALWAADDAAGDLVALMRERVVAEDPGTMPSCLVHVGVRRFTAALVRVGQLPTERAVAYSEALVAAALHGGAPPRHPGDSRRGPFAGCDRCPAPCTARAAAAAGVVPGTRALAIELARAPRAGAVVDVLSAGLDGIARELSDLAPPDIAEAFGLCVTVQAAERSGVARRFASVERPRT